MLMMLCGVSDDARLCGLENLRLERRLGGWMRPGWPFFFRLELRVVELINGVGAAYGRNEMISGAFDVVDVFGSEVTATRWRCGGGCGVKVC